ncbi:MAG: transcriptional regulator [Acidimicrobiia bacterium]|nr:transcriptional regulator [Acidimicrobiia bacterium]
MTAVELRLLGGFGLEVDGRRIEMTPAAQRLLAFVALTPRGAERSYTAFQLWPEQSEERAKANLRSTLWRLSKAPADLIVATKTHLRLCPWVWLDVRHGLAELAAAGSEAIVAAALPFQALDSDLLPDWYDDWLTIERERLRQLRLGSLEEAARSATAAGQFGQAVQLALATVSIDPLRESGHRLAIEAHLANGNRFDARRQYDTYARLLRTLAAATPSRQLTRLVEPFAEPATLVSVAPHAVVEPAAA